MKIISTVPSITELLSDLGLGDEVIGITKFCVHPEEWYREKARIGGTKNLNIEKIMALQPDLIIANKEENDKEQIELLSQHFKVHVTDVKTLDDNVSLILEIGKLTGREVIADSLVHQFKEVVARINYSDTHTAVYLIWWNPLMTVGSDTFIHSVMAHCGFVNLFDQQSRYPETSIEALKALQPEYLLLSSEPFPFRQNHIEYFKEHLPDTNVCRVDGESFSWYGTRILKSRRYLQSVINDY